MKSCLNINHPHYQAIANKWGKYNADILIYSYNDNVYSLKQSLDDVVYPTLDQLEDYIKNYNNVRVDIISNILNYNNNVSFNTLRKFLTNVIDNNNNIVNQEIAKQLTLSHPENFSIQNNQLFYKPIDENNIYDNIDLDDFISPSPLKSDVIDNLKPSLPQNLTNSVLHQGIISSLETLSKRFNIPYIIDPTLDKKGAVRYGVIIINPYLATKDTPFHEYLHPFVNYLKRTNPTVYKILSNKLNDVYTINNELVIDVVQRNNPELNQEDLIEESIVQALGLSAVNELLETPSSKTLIDYIKEFLYKLMSLFSPYLKQIDLNQPFSQVVNYFLTGNYVIDYRQDIKNANQNIDVKSLLNEFSNTITVDDTKTYTIDDEDFNRVYVDSSNPTIPMKSFHDEFIRPLQKSYKWYDPMQPESERSKLLAAFGTDLHNLIDNTFNCFVEDNKLRNKYISKEDFVNNILKTFERKAIIKEEQLNKSYYFMDKATLKLYAESSYDYYANFVNHFEQKYGKDVMFFKEQRIRDKYYKYAGTIDLLIVSPSQKKFEIFDWKSIQTIDNNKNRKEILPSYKEHEYLLQLTTYSKMFKAFFPDYTYERSTVVLIDAQLEGEYDHNLQKYVFYPPNTLKIGSFIEEPEMNDLLMSPVIDKGDLSNPIDRFITKLSIYADQIKEGTFNKSNVNSFLKNVNYYQLVKIIKQLKSTNERTLLFNRIHTLINKVDYISQSKEESEDNRLTTRDLNELKDLLEELSIYTNLNDYLRDDISDTKLEELSEEEIEKRNEFLNIQKGVQIATETAQNLITSEMEYLAESEFNIKNLSSNEKKYTGVKAWMKSISTISDVKTIKFLYSLIKKYYNKAISNKQNHIKEFTDILNELKKTGDLKTHFSYLFRTDNNGKKIPVLIQTIDYEKIYSIAEDVDNFNKDDYFEFNKDLYDKDLAYVIMDLEKQVVKLSSEQIKEVRERGILEFDTLAPELKVKYKNYEGYIRELIKDKTEEIRQEKRDNLIIDFMERNQNPIITRTDGTFEINKRYFKLKDNDILYSKEYIELRKDKGRIKLYNKIIELNKKAVRLGVMRKGTYSFYPSVMAKASDKIAEGGLDKAFNLSELFNSMNPDNVTDDFDTTTTVNKLTGEVQRNIKKLYRNDLRKATSDGETDYSDYSFDAIRVYSLFANFLEEYEYKKELEEKAPFIELIEKKKRNIITDAKGKAIKDPYSVTSSYLTSQEVSQNLPLLQKFINFYIYGERGVSNKAVYNKEFKILGKRFKFNGLRILSGIMAWRSNTTLGLNLSSATSSFFGAMLNNIVEAGRNGIFSTKDFKDALAQSGTLIYQDKKALLTLGILSKIDLMIDNLDNERATTLSYSNLQKALTTDNLYVLLRNADKMAQYITANAVLRNYMVDSTNNKLLKISDVAKAKLITNNMAFDEYYNFLTANSKFKEAKELEKQLESEINKLKEKESIYAKNIEYDGDYKDFTEEIKNEIRPIIKKANKQVIGNASRDDVSQLKTTILGTMLLQFKNWMPQLVMQRFGNAEMDNDTYLLNWGKYNTFVHMLQNDALMMIKSLKGDLNIISYNNIYTKYADMLEEHIANGGTEQNFISFADFKQLYINNIKSTFKELAMVIAFFSLIASLGLMFRGGDDDEPLEGWQRYTLRLLNKIQNEISFYFLPSSYIELFKNPIPAINTLDDLTKFIAHSSGETFNQIQNVITKDEEKDLKRYKPSKYFFKLFPITKEMIMWNAILDEEFRKEYNVQI